LNFRQTRLVFSKSSTFDNSETETANVNFFTTTGSTTFTQYVRSEATEFHEITQNKGHYAVQGHSRSPILVSIESSYTTSYLWLILTYLLHRFRDIAFQNRYIWLHLLRLAAQTEEFSILYHR